MLTRMLLVIYAYLALLPLVFIITFLLLPFGLKTVKQFLIMLDAKQFLEFKQAAFFIKHG